jgi:hypothetical protein
VLGVPVSVLGLLGYLALIGTSGVRSELAAALGATCEWCLASDALLVALVPLTVARLLRRS